MKRSTAQEIVVLTRTLRNGSITEERVERWLAELIVGCIPSDEPHVARASIAPLPVDDYRARSYPVKPGSQAHLQQRALALVQAAYGPNPLNVNVPRVA